MSDETSVGNPWERSPVPVEHQIHGLGSITITLTRLASTDLLLTEVLGRRQVRAYPASDDSRSTVRVFEMGPGDPAAELHIAVRPDLPFACRTRRSTTNGNASCARLALPPFLEPRRATIEAGLKPIG